MRRGHVGRGSLGALVVAGEVSSNSRRLSVTSATSLAEMFVLMMPLPTHGSYCTSRTSPGRRLAFTFTSWFAVVAVQRLPGREEAWPARRCPRRIAVADLLTPLLTPQRLPMCSIGSIRLASSLSSLCECMAFCVQRSLQNSSLAEGSEFTDIRAAGRPRLHLVPCANMAHFSTSFCNGPRMVIGGIVQHGHTDANSGPLARAHPSRSR